MKKLTQLLTAYNKVAKIPKDKLLHRLFGAYICGISTVGIFGISELSLTYSALLGVVIAFIAGLVKDYIIDPKIGGTKDFNDVLWTLCGGLDVGGLVWVVGLIKGLMQ